MKKIAVFFLISISVFVFSGCSSKSDSGEKANPNSNIWKSSNGGDSWDPKNKGEKINFTGIDVISLTINPYDSNNVYLGLRGSGILKTDDGGETWRYLNYQPEKVYGLDIDPIDSRIVYASGVWQKRGKIYKSLDGGETWKEIYTSPSTGPLVIALTIDKRNPNVIYASTSDNQVIKSSDYGTSWQNIFTAQAPVTKIVMDSFNSNLLYLLVQGKGLFRSRNAGANFEDANSNQTIGEQLKKEANVQGRPVQSGNFGTSSDIIGIVTDPNIANGVYVFGAAGILRSKDAGQSWEKLDLLNNSKNFPVRALAVNPANSREMVYGAAQTAYKSIDGGAKWTTFQFTSSKAINTIKYSQAAPNALYLGFSK